MSDLAGLTNPYNLSKTDRNLYPGRTLKGGVPT